MKLKITPKVSPRYWVAIMAASMCGTNLGDFLPDVLRLNSLVGLMLLIAAFVAIVLLDRLAKFGSEAFYWLSILIIRAAATNIADLFVKQGHFGYFTIAAALAVLLAVLLVVHPRQSGKPSSGDLPASNGFYWLTMLTAGALGTVFGDGMIHSFSSVQTGALTSAALATIAVAVILEVRARMSSRPIVSYWVAVVAIRWWGTNLGDILAFFLTIPVSLIGTGLLLAAILWAWREPVWERSDKAIPGQA